MLPGITEQAPSFDMSAARQKLAASLRHIGQPGV
jgi:hypothetical protein